VQRYTPLDEQELFSAGLLHDVGKLAIAAGSAGTLESVRLRSVAGSLPFFSAEAEAPHATIGAMLAEQWHLPPELRRAIGGHHTPSGGAAAIVNVADVMAHLVGYTIFSGEVLPPVDETALAAIPLPPERLKIIAEDGLDELFALECAFGIAGPMATAG
jgi:HD-like signal output (HDOD) protein